MKRFWRHLAPSIAVCLIAAGCGGGSSDEGASIPVVPAPTPTPLPSPTATPTPTATTYQSPNDYTTSFDFASSLGYAADTFVPDNGSSSSSLGVYALSEDQSVQLTFTAQPEAVRIQYAGGGASWSSVDRVAVGVSQRTYRRGSEEIMLGFEGRSATYVTKAAWRTFLGADTINGVVGRRARINFGIVGATTALSDIPASAAFYRGSTILFGGARSDGYTNYVDATISYQLRTNNEVVGTIYAFDRSAPDRSTTLIAAGQLSRATGMISGTLANSDGTFTGTFRGRLFGPEAREMAIVFRAQRSTDRNEFVGDFVGAR